METSTNFKLVTIPHTSAENELIIRRKPLNKMMLLQEKIETFVSFIYDKTFFLLLFGRKDRNPPSENRTNRSPPAEDERFSLRWMQFQVPLGFLSNEIFAFLIFACLEDRGPSGG